MKKYQHYRANGYTRVYDRAYAYAYARAYAYTYARDYVCGWHKVNYRWSNPK